MQTCRQWRHAHLMWRQNNFFRLILTYARHRHHDSPCSRFDVCCWICLQRIWNRNVGRPNALHALSDWGFKCLIRLFSFLEDECRTAAHYLHLLPSIVWADQSGGLHLYLLPIYATVHGVQYDIFYTSLERPRSIMHLIFRLMRQSWRNNIWSE